MLYCPHAHAMLGAAEEHPKLTFHPILTQKWSLLNSHSTPSHFEPTFHPILTQKWSHFEDGTHKPIRPISIHFISNGSVGAKREKRGTIWAPPTTPREADRNVCGG